MSAHHRIERIYYIDGSMLARLGGDASKFRASVLEQNLAHIGLLLMRELHKNKGLPVSVTLEEIVSSAEPWNGHREEITLSLRLEALRVVKLNPPPMTFNTSDLTAMVPSTTVQADFDEPANPPTAEKFLSDLGLTPPAKAPTPKPKSTVVKLRKTVLLGPFTYGLNSVLYRHGTPEISEDALRFILCAQNPKHAEYTIFQEGDTNAPDIQINPGAKISLLGPKNVRFYSIPSINPGDTPL